MKTPKPKPGEVVPVRKAVQAKPTARHKDRTKYDREAAKRHVDCRSVLLDPKED
jgi:hypothetical protein